ncbi:MAG: glycosyltransferase, partial [Hydrogenobaculum sp.]
MQKNNLYIYGTVFNNAKWVRDSINSIKSLNPKEIIIADAMSNDGTYEILKELNVKVIRTGERMSRGKGRQIALNEVLKIAKPDDFVMYIDLDTIYTQKFIDYVKNFIDNPPEKTIGIGMLSRVQDNLNVEWRDLNS